MAADFTLVVDDLRAAFLAATAAGSAVRGISFALGRERPGIVGNLVWQVRPGAPSRACRHAWRA
jgi:hypothetical protein